MHHRPNNPFHTSNTSLGNKLTSNASPVTSNTANLGAEEFGLDREQMRMAFALWYPNYGHADADTEITPFLKIEIEPQAYSRLKRARLASCLSTGEMARRLGIDRAAYTRFETAEASGKIKFETLAKAAEAMNCELVYAIRPRCRRHFSEIVWEQLINEIAARAHIHSKWPDHIKIRSLASYARDKLQNPKFRRQTKWSKRWRLDN